MIIAMMQQEKLESQEEKVEFFDEDLSLIHISEPTRHTGGSRMPSSA